MKLLKKWYFYIWFASVVILAVDLFAYCAFIMGTKTVKAMIIDLIWLAIGVALQFYARKKLTYKEGYTAIQAIQLYRKCIRAGITTQREFRDNIETVTKFAQSYGIKEQGKTLEYIKIFEKGRNCYTLFKK